MASPCSRFIPLFALLASLLAGGRAAQAFPRFSKAEGKPCGYCHINPAGGGRRNYRGLYYKAHNFSFANFDDAAEAKAAGVDIGPNPTPPPKSQTPAAGAATTTDAPKISDTDRTRLAEAFQLSDSIGEKVWTGWQQTPFAVLLVTPDAEFLIRHPKPSDDFTKIGHDDQLQSDIYYRKRTLETNLLATYPAVGGVSTIVVGQAENTTAKTSTPWVLTLLHEHFHQFQDANPQTATKAAALGLAKEDKTGQWMLNYAFPYEDAKVDAAFANLSNALAGTFAGKVVNGSARAAAIRKAEQAFQKTVSPDDYKYYQFQLWKEGIARYTEYRIGVIASKGYQPSKAFAALPDYTSYAAASEKLYTDMVDGFKAPALAKDKRVSFYGIGLGEGLLLDAVSPKWKESYFNQALTIEPLWKK